MAIRSKVLTIVLCFAILTAAIGAASADLLYIGETPGTGMASYSSQFTGDTASDTLWDYAYKITDFSGGPGDPTTLAVYARFPIENAWLSDDANWDWTWDSSIDGTEPDYGTSLTGTWFEEGNQQGVVFYLTGIFPASDPIFHFQSNISPALAHYALVNGSADEGVEWSAAPEPTTLLLTSIGVVGLGLLRRRRSG